MRNNENKLVIKSHKFNIVDIFLLITIILAVCVLIYLGLGNTVINTEEEATILFKIDIPIIKNEMLPDVRKIEIGSEIIDSVRNQPLGIVHNLEIEDAYSLVTNQVTGVVERKPHPEYSRVIITIKAKCEKSEIRYVVNGRTIMVGMKIDFRTPHLISYGNCIYLDEIEDSDSASAKNK